MTSVSSKPVTTVTAANAHNVCYKASGPYALVSQHDCKVLASNSTPHVEGVRTSVHKSTVAHTRTRTPTFVPASHCQPTSHKPPLLPRAPHLTMASTHTRVVLQYTLTALILKGHQVRGPPTPPPPTPIPVQLRWCAPHRLLATAAVPRGRLNQPIRTGDTPQPEAFPRHQQPPLHSPQISCQPTRPVSCCTVRALVCTHHTHHPCKLHVTHTCCHPVADTRSTTGPLARCRPDDQPLLNRLQQLQVGWVCRSVRSAVRISRQLPRMRGAHTQVEQGCALAAATAAPGQRMLGTKGTHTHTHGQTGGERQTHNTGAHVTLWQLPRCFDTDNPPQASCCSQLSSNHVMVHVHVHVQAGLRPPPACNARVKSLMHASLTQDPWQGPCPTYSTHAQRATTRRVLSVESHPAKSKHTAVACRLSTPRQLRAVSTQSLPDERHTAAWWSGDTHHMTTAVPSTHQAGCKRGVGRQPEAKSSQREGSEQPWLHCVSSAGHCQWRRCWLAVHMRCGPIECTRSGSMGLQLRVASSVRC